jgi:hypothetical protein
MWKPEHRLAADRSGLRYPSDLTDAEWVIVEPMIPPATHGGRKRTIDDAPYTHCSAVLACIVDFRVFAGSIAAWNRSQLN